MANVKKIKTGTLNVAVEEEEALWCDRKRWLLFGLPFTFTKYTLTPSRLYIQTGFFNQKEDEIRLYRITDITMFQKFGERLAGVGTICLLSSDKTSPELHLIHIKKPKKVKAVLSQCIEKARAENGVRTSEVVGGGLIPGHGGPEAPESVGPDIVPDVNGNGVDDRTEA